MRAGAAAEKRPDARRHEVARAYRAPREAGERGGGENQLRTAARRKDASPQVDLNHGSSGSKRRRGRILLALCTHNLHHVPDARNHRARGARQKTLCARRDRPGRRPPSPRASAGEWLPPQVLGAGAVCWKIHPTAVEWANASATFEPHEILGVAWDASERVLRSAYRRLALAHHPDKGGDPARFRLIVQAYEALMNRLHGLPDF